MGRQLVSKLKYWCQRGHIVYRTTRDDSGILYKLMVPKSVNLLDSVQSQEVMYTPIRQLNSFLKDWCIKVRVTLKQPLRITSKGSSLLKLIFMDKDSTEIEAACFG